MPDVRWNKSGVDAAEGDELDENEIVEYVAVWVTREYEWRVMVGKVKERCTEILKIRWKKILKWILGNYFGMVWNGFIWLRIGKSGGFCEDGNELSGYSKCGEFYCGYISFWRRSLHNGFHYLAAYRILCLVKRKLQCFISWTNWPTSLSSHPISQNYSFLYNPGPKQVSRFFHCLIPAMPSA